MSLTVCPVEFELTKVNLVKFRMGNSPWIVVTKLTLEPHSEYLGWFCSWKWIWWRSECETLSFFISTWIPYMYMIISLFILCYWLCLWMTQFEKKRYNLHWPNIQLLKCFSKWRGKIKILKANFSKVGTDRALGTISWLSVLTAYK